MVPNRFTLSLTDVPVEVDITVDQIFATTIDFTYFHSPYTFRVTKWSGNGLKYFLPLFFQYAPRDAVSFGSYDVVNDTYVGNSTQKMSCIVQACHDIMACLNKLILSMQREIIDYAVWYRERIKGDETTLYSKYITVMTCHNIVHTSFMAGRVTYDLVEF
jgi:hypothetical protein